MHVRIEVHFLGWAQVLLLLLCAVSFVVFTNVFFQTLTNSFKAYDTNRNGWIRISYEQFLMLVFSLKA